MTPIRAFAFVMAPLFLTSGCSRSVATELRVPDGTPIVLISVDTLRSDRLPAYGYDGVETPAIDRLREDGILFENAYTHVPLTLPAHCTLLSGLLPSTHGVRDNLGYTLESSEAPLLQQTLKSAGYATGAGVSAYALRGQTGIAAGFDVYKDQIEIAPGARDSGVQSVQRPGGETLRAVRPWLESVVQAPFFLFFHTFEPHTPYEPPARYAARYPSPYDGEVAAADDVVGDVLDALRELDIYDRALIIFLSDHGEDLGDHGEGEHGVFLYRSTLQVPLIIKLPRSARAGETVSYPVGLVDIYPTLVGALGLPRMEQLEGTPLVAQDRPEAWQYPIYAETFFPRLHFGWSDLAALIVERHHFIDAPRPELYDLVQDPDERENLLGSEPALEAELRTVLGHYDRRLEGPEATDAETRRKLEALGYVGGATTTEDEVLPDPKDRVHWMTDIQRAYQLFHDGELEAALPEFQRILEANPNIEDAWGYLALAQMELGRREEAIETFEAALEQLPHSRRLSMRAALLYEHLGRLDEAAVYANIAIAGDPAAAHLLLARIAFKEGDFESAEREAQAAISSGDMEAASRLLLADIYIARSEPYKAIDLLTRTVQEGISPKAVFAKLGITYVWVGEFDKAAQVLKGFEGTNDMPLLMAFGELEISRGQWTNARNYFERALALDPDNPTIKLNLGQIALAQERLPEARILIQESLAADLNSFEGWSALGMVFARQGDVEGAVIAWERAREVNPNVIEILFNLGLGHAQLGNLHQAIGFLEDFVARAQPGPQQEQAVKIAQQLRVQASQGR